MTFIKRPLLIIGGTGLLGLALIKRRPGKLKIIPTYAHYEPKKGCDQLKFAKLDITHKNEVNLFITKLNPYVVIHAASMGNVDFCEKNKQTAYQVNVKGTENIISACNKTNSKIIFISSNAVFSGNEAPYSETSQVSPINYYGKTKVLGEEIIKQSKLNYTIVRLVLMYGWNYKKERSNAVTWLLKKLKNKEKVKIVNDTYVNPVLNIQAADAIWRIVTLDKKGLFHVGGAERTNRYDFARLTADVFKYDKNLIKPVSSNYFQDITKRMHDTTYNTQKMEKELKIRPLTLREGLTYMKINYENI